MKAVKVSTYEATKFYMEENEKGLSKSKVADMFKIDRHSFCKLTWKDKYKELVFPKEDNGYCYYFEPKEWEAIQEYINNPNITKKEIRDKYNISQNGVFSHWLEILGYEDTVRYKYNFKRDIFREEPTPEMAYWLGFLLADGCIIENKIKGNSKDYISYNVTVRLGDKDKEHVYKFAKFLQYPKEKLNEVIKPCYGGAYDRNNLCWVIDVCSTDLCKDLQKYNITPRKSLKEKPFIFNDRELELNYIRGIIDGDGWIRKPTTRDLRMGVVGSEEVCNYISSVLKEYFPHKMEHAKPKAHSESIGSDLYYWQTTCREGTKNVLELLYPENCPIYLDRKYDLARAVLKLLN